jgi:MFS family permease
VFFVENGVNSTILPLYLNSLLRYDVSIIGLLMGVRSVGFIIANFLTGPLSDRLGRRFFLLVGAALYATVFALFSLLTQIEFLVLLMIVLGVANGMVQVTLPVLAAESVDPHLRGVAIGTFRTSFDVGAIVGPIVTTLILNSLGILSCFYAAALVMVANLALALAIRKT